MKIFHFSFFSLHHWCKALTAERSTMTPLAAYFSKSRLMARFQSPQGVHFYKKQEIEDVIGDLEVPDDVLFFVETDTLVRLKPSHEPRF